jgi:acyl-CoA reductase-like NAD-dependent aldehyde dehydrogenase
MDGLVVALTIGAALAFAVAAALKHSSAAPLPELGELSEAGVPAGWVTGDEVYGQHSRLRMMLEDRGCLTCSRFR